jgi:hypothetical protein
MKYTETKTAVLTIVFAVLFTALGFLLCKAILKPIIKITLADHCIVKEKILYPKDWDKKWRK